MGQQFFANCVHPIWFTNKYHNYLLHNACSNAIEKKNPVYFSTDTKIEKKPFPKKNLSSIEKKIVKKNFPPPDLQSKCKKSSNPFS